MRHIQKTALLFACLGAAFAANAQDSAAGAPEAAAQQPAAVATAADALPDRIDPPDAGMGQIVFFRESKMMGAAISYKVREGEQELGKLSSGTFFVVQVAPGAHTYTVHSEAKDVLNMEVEAGETYFVVGSVTMGVFAGRPNLSPSTAAVFQGMAKKLRPAKPLK